MSCHPHPDHPSPQSPHFFLSPKKTDPLSPLPFWAEACPFSLLLHRRFYPQLAARPTAHVRVLGQGWDAVSWPPTRGNNWLCKDHVSLLQSDLIASSDFLFCYWGRTTSSLCLWEQQGDSQLLLTLRGPGSTWSLPVFRKGSQDPAFCSAREADRGRTSSVLWKHFEFLPALKVSATNPAGIRRVTAC